MTIRELYEMISSMASARMGLEAYSNYLQQRERPDKYLREEHLAIAAVFRYEEYDEGFQVELGYESEPWDARVEGIRYYEVVQALPKNENIIRNAIATGKAEIKRRTKPSTPPKKKFEIIEGGGALKMRHEEHQDDELQFPQAIIDAIKLKKGENYPSPCTLIVVFDGDYSSEDDAIVMGWLPTIRSNSSLGNFHKIVLVERGRMKVFPVF